MDKNEQKTIKVRVTKSPAAVPKTIKVRVTKVQYPSTVEVVTLEATPPLKPGYKLSKRDKPYYAGPAKVGIREGVVGKVAAECVAESDRTNIVSALKRGTLAEILDSLGYDLVKRKAANKTRRGTNG